MKIRDIHSELNFVNQKTTAVRQYYAHPVVLLRNGMTKYLPKPVPTYCYKVAVIDRLFCDVND